MKQSWKKLFIIPLAVAVLASCGNNSSTSSSNSSSDAPASNSSQIPTPSSSTEKPTSSENVIHVEGIRLDKTTAELTVGSELTLIATVTPENATDKSYTFSSSNTAVASVNNEGKVSAIGAGEATITVATTDGNKTAACIITVKEAVISVDSVAFADAETTLYPGETKTLSVSVLPENATNKAVTFDSSDKGVATIDETGKVTALQAGETTITVTSVDGNKTDTCLVKVLNNVYTFLINDGTDAGSKSLTKNLNIDDTQSDEIKLTVLKNGNTWRGGEIEMSVSGDTGVISVTESAETLNAFDVRILGVGSASVTFTLKGYEVEPLTVNYAINEYFLNQTIRRGSVSEANNEIRTNGEGQHTGVVKTADTKWVFRTRATVEEYTGGESVGVGGFLDNGDHALWFGLRNEDGNPDNISSAYIRDFYDGWGNAKFDRVPDYYDNLSFEETEDHKNIVLDFEVIRNGVDYYYSIGGRHGKYTSTASSANEASYPGFFSQNKNVTFTNYSVDYSQETVNNAIAASYTSEAKIDAGKFVSPKTTEIIREQSRDFAYAVAPSYSEEAVMLAVDEAYEQYVTIDDMKITISGDAPAGTLNLSLKSASGKILDTIQIPVVEQSSEKSNEQLTVKGGVILNDDGSIFFPEGKMSTDGVGSREDRYADDIDYGATLNQKVLGGDFSLEFDVSNYKTNVQYPKLMVSLGGEMSQFYIAYGYGGGTNSRIETMTYSKQVYVGQWNNTEDFPGNFDQTATHHFKIESKNGFYNFYLDGSDTPLAQKMDAQARNIIVPIDGYAKELPVRISTRGVSAKVSNIQVTTGTPADLNKAVAIGEKTTVTDDGYLMTLPCTPSGEDAWSYHRNRKNLAVYPRAYLENLDAGYKATFNVTFSRMMNDGKVVVGLGNQEFHICNSTTNDWKKIQEVDCTGRWGDNFTGIDLSAEKLTLPVTVVNDGKGNVTFSVPNADGTMINVPSKVDGITADMPMYFFTFNNNAEDNECTATISDINVEALETVTE